VSSCFPLEISRKMLNGDSLSVSNTTANLPELILRANLKATHHFVNVAFVDNFIFSEMTQWVGG
jgi:hypothetical protein